MSVQPLERMGGASGDVARPAPLAAPASPPEGRAGDRTEERGRSEVPSPRDPPAASAADRPGAAPAWRRRSFRVTLAVAITVGLAVVAGGWRTETSLPPTIAVLTVSRNLPAGHRLVPGDLVMLSLPVRPGGDALLLTRDLQGLIPGEYLTQAAMPGSPLLTTQITPGQTGRPQPVPATSLCRHE